MKTENKKEIKILLRAILRKGSVNVNPMSMSVSLANYISSRGNGLQLRHLDSGLISVELKK